MGRGDTIYHPSTKLAEETCFHILVVYFHVGETQSYNVWKGRNVYTIVENPHGAIADHVEFSFDPPHEIQRFLYWSC